MELPCFGDTLGCRGAGGCRERLQRAHGWGKAREMLPVKGPSAKCG